MNSQTDNQTDLAGLDFDVSCAVVWVQPTNPPCGANAVADMTFINGSGNGARKFTCEECIDRTRAQGRLVNVTYI